MQVRANLNTMEKMDAFPQLRGKSVIVFDGECVLCSGFFDFVVKRDHSQEFYFVVAQSALGEALYDHFGLKSGDYDTNLVLLDGRLFTELDALAAVLREIGGIWKGPALIRFLPKFLKTFLYNRIARNRYSIFGRREACYMPTPELEARFLG